MHEQLPLPGTQDATRDTMVPARAAISPIPVDETVRRHFWANVIRTPGCWFWVGAISTPDGYGRITWRRGGRQRSMSVHRFALSITETMDIDRPGVIAEHVCNEPLCVRVDSEHVRVSNQSANLAYAVRLGRHQGPRPTSSVNRVERSQEIRRWLLGGGDPLALPASWHDADQLALF